VVSWTTHCADEGATKNVSICFPELGDSCECPSCLSVEIIVLPDLTLYTTDETFEVRRIYEYCSPNGGPVDLALAVADIAAQINSDLYFTGTATAITDPGDAATACDLVSCPDAVAAIEIVGYTGQDYDVFAVEACVATSQAFARPFLTETDLKRTFPIKPGAFGSSPARDKIACGDDYCLDIAIIKHTDVQDIDSTNVENYLEEVYIYSPAASGLKGVLDAFVTSGDFGTGDCTTP